MVDLKIRYDVLTTSSSSLDDIYNAFDKLKTRTSATDSDWGSSAIKGAMHDFSDDWDAHRHKIMKSLEDIKKLVDTAVQGFGQTDGDLANSVQTTSVHRTVGGRSARAE